MRSRGAALPPDGLPPTEILDSWVRCMQAGLDRARRPPVQVVEAADLARRRERADVVRRLALAELETLCAADRRLELPARLRRPAKA